MNYYGEDDNDDDHIQAMALLGNIVTNPNGKTFTNLKRTSIPIHEQFKFKFLDIVHETKSNQGWTRYCSTILSDLRMVRNKQEKISISKVPIFSVKRLYILRCVDDFEPC